MANQINWGKIYCYSNWGYEANKKSVPEFPATCNPVVEDGVCGVVYQWDDINPAFPKVFNISINQAGESFIDFEAYNRPTKFVVVQSGVTLVDTGYRSSAPATWQTQLDSYLTARGLPLETITQPSSNIIDFNANRDLLVYVYAPLEKIGFSGWEFRIGCPV
jgi:hypothetical protein|tara:strand:- start:5346 stop:5831 length:486 start_codon:yes stop_codon:yes gene_type:complete